ncbi:lysylphosphatidylglycerol synthase transmembrane domain-containing protein [Bacillaceae bacterium IKA-2]|nr:lysylphosphatidylglycerol synthase transmembrane domain-containing protein [Bacillaceae bacterium IKA-2]
MEATISKTKKMMSGKIQLIFRALVSIVACFFLVFTIDWLGFNTQLKTVNLVFLLMAFLFVLLCIFISGYKWYLLLKVERKVSFYDCFRWYYIGFFFNSFLPGSIGGDGFRIYYAGKKVSISKAVASVTVERLFAGIALLLTAFIGLLYVNDSGHIFFQLVFFLILIGLIYCFLFVTFFQKKLTGIFGSRLDSFYETISTYKNERGLLVKVLLFSLLFQLSFVLVTDMLFRAFDVNVSFLAQLGFVSVISLLTMLPISIGGIGVREGAYVYLFALVGVHETVSVAVSLLFFILVLIGTSFGVVYWIVEKKEVSKCPIKV